MAEDNVRLMSPNTVEAETFSLRRIAGKLQQYSEDARAVVAANRIEEAIRALNSGDLNPVGEPVVGATVADAVLRDELAAPGPQDDASDA